MGLDYTKRMVKVRDARMLCLHRWDPHAGNPDRLIIVQHGFGEHAKRYQQVIDYLDNGTTCFVGVDAYGHGESEGTRGHIPALAEYGEDLDLILQGYVLKDLPAIKVCLFGHSLGGVIATQYLCYAKSASRVDRAVISSPAYKVVMDFSKQVKKSIAGLLASVAPSFTLDAGGSHEHLSRDPAVGKEFDEDPLCHNRVSFRLGVDLLSIPQQYLSAAHLIKCPVLLIHGTGDQITDAEGTKEFSRRLALANKVEHKLLLLPGYYHETFNEPGDLKLAALEPIKSWFEH